MLDNTKVVVFSVANEELCLPLQNIISIERYQQLTEIPHMPLYMVGVATLREELVPILDSSLIFFDSKAVISDKTRILVLKTAEYSVGLIVNEAKEILDISSDQINQLALAVYQGTTYINGIVNLDGRLITMIKPTALLESLEGLNDIKDHIHSHQ